MQREISYFSPSKRRWLLVTLEEATSFWRVFFRISGFGAITLPGRRIVMMEHNLFDQAVISHELAHVEQYERLGTARFLWSYFTLWIKHGYRNHPLEIEARRHEKGK